MTTEHTQQLPQSTSLFNAQVDQLETCIRNANKKLFGFEDLQEMVLHYQKLLKLSSKSDYCDYSRSFHALNQLLFLLNTRFPDKKTQENFKYNFEKFPAFTCLVTQISNQFQEKFVFPLTLITLIITCDQASKVRTERSFFENIIQDIFIGDKPDKCSAQIKDVALKCVSEENIQSLSLLMNQFLLLYSEGCFYGKKTRAALESNNNRFLVYINFARTSLEQSKSIIMAPRHDVASTHCSRSRYSDVASLEISDLGSAVIKYKREMKTSPREERREERRERFIDTIKTHDFSKEKLESFYQIYLPNFRYLSLINHLVNMTTTTRLQQDELKNYFLKFWNCEDNRNTLIENFSSYAKDNNFDVSSLSSTDHEEAHSFISKVNQLRDKPNKRNLRILCVTLEVMEEAIDFDPHKTFKMLDNDESLKKEIMKSIMSSLKIAKQLYKNASKSTNGQAISLRV